MDEFNSYIKLICIVGIVAGVLMTVIPKGRMKNSFTSLCAVVTVSAMIVPINALFEKDIGGMEVDITESSESLALKTNQAESQIFEKVVADSIESKLKNEGISAEIEVDGEISREEIIIKSVTVNGVFEDGEIIIIKSIIESDFGEVNIIF